MNDTNSTPSTEAGQGLEAEANSEAGTETRTAQLEAQLKEKEAKYLYLYAEFENFKKRAQKEREDTRKFGWESVARGLLEVLDNLDRAVAHAAIRPERACPFPSTPRQGLPGSVASMEI